MGLLGRLEQLVKDPPPEYIFELSEGGIACARDEAQPQIRFHPLAGDVLAVSPVSENVLRPEALAESVKSLVQGNGNRKSRRVALILPDYCARVSVLDFDSFPHNAQEQAALVRFRVKKSVPFDVDSAVIGFHAQQRPGGVKKFDVVAAVVTLEIIGKYEAPFRAAGLHPGFITTSTLAGLDLVKRDGLTVVLKRTGLVISVAVLDGVLLRMIRTVELAAVDAGEVMGVLFPTFAYVEDETGRQPERLLVCGFGPNGEMVRDECQSELGVAVEPLRSRFGVPDEGNAGLLGYLESVKD